MKCARAVVMRVVVVVRVAKVVGASVMVVLMVMLVVVMVPTTITAGRSDSGYSNTSSPRGSTLTLHPAAPSPPAADHTKLPRPLSAPGHLPLVPRLVLPNASTHTQTDGPPSGSSSHTPRSSIPRPAKPTPPPKPASIRRAVSNLARRPTSIPCKSRSDRHSQSIHINNFPTGRRYISSLQRTPAPAPPRPLPSSRPTSRPSSKPPSRSPSICSRLQECYNTVQSDSVTQAQRTDLDNKVLDIANQTQDYCGCKDEDCRKAHIKRVADGKYEICGKNVYVRYNTSSNKTLVHRNRSPSSALSPCKHNIHCHTVEQFLKRIRLYKTPRRIFHCPRVTVFNLKSAEPFLHIRAKYCSPTNSGASSIRGSPTHSRATPSRVTASEEPSSGNTSSEGTPPPPTEPQVPTSPPPVSSMPATENSTSITDIADAGKECFIPSDENSMVSTEERPLSNCDSRGASFISLSNSAPTDPDSFYSLEDHAAEVVTGVCSESNSIQDSSPTVVLRPIVNSTTFTAENHNTDDPIEAIIQSSHSKQPSTSSAYSFISESTTSDISPKVTPPPTPSTFSNPACITSAPLDASLTTNGSTTSLGTPLPPDDES
ncbi:hypothetical protein E2C01_023061 [Portunus trituberculatus]|uniref:Uncharacterized protein n=1 Tax=Portunus trituberculatus TaxID=210409 RepID=A0A5B7E706_PORTR|nr:hypothetical protein [Portunus trituberculatus]